jgi:mono/diheme cytochrome c family protein
MPVFGAAFSDQQIADVVNYIRTHFGNSYKDRVTPDDVKAAR